MSKETAARRFQRNKKSGASLSAPSRFRCAALAVAGGHCGK